MAEKQRIPLAQQMYIDQFSGGTLTSVPSFMRNTMVEKHTSDSGDRLYVTQRPAIDLFEDASITVTGNANSRGRGIYYWEAADKIFFINNDTVYYQGYASSISTNISAGTQRCQFVELGSNLYILDSENNEMWAITDGSPPTLAAVTDTDAPHNAGTMVGGGAVMDGFLFALDNTGLIYHSALDDGTSWYALDITTAEREDDKGVWLGKHHDHIVVLGTRTIEFFYNAGNPVGSVLNRRQDVYYTIGCAHVEGVWQDGDTIFFVGRTYRGDLGVYTINNFQLKKISTPTFDGYLTQAYSKASLFPLFSGFSARGHLFLILTIYRLSVDTVPIVTPQYTFVYDQSTGLWQQWDTDLDELSDFTTSYPLVDWTISTSSRYGEGVLVNGDRITLHDSFSGADTFDAVYYFDDVAAGGKYVEDDYMETYGTDSVNSIEIEIQIGNIDEGTNNSKFINSVSFVGRQTETDQDLYIKWSDGYFTDFNTAKALPLDKPAKLYRGGMAYRRTYNLIYSGSDVFKGEALELDYSGGIM